jgi:hypothetical protein
MKKKLLLVAAIGALAAALAVPSAMATTAPAVSVQILVTVSDKAATFSTTGGRRGWAAHFTVRNVGKKPHRFEIGGLKSKLLKPGEKGKIGAYLEDRGAFEWKVDNGGPRLQGFFKVV